MTKDIRNTLKGVAGLFTLLSFGACTTLDTMVADFETRWANPAAALAETAPPTPEDLARLAEAETALLAQAEQAILADDCTAIHGAAYKVFAIDAEHLEMSVALAECALEARDLAAARAQFTVIADKSNDPRAQRGLGLVSILDGKYMKGRTYLTSASQLLSNDWRTWNGLGFAEDALENWAAAEAAYLHAARLAENEVGPLNNLAMSYIRQEEYPKAIKTLQRGLIVDSRSSVLQLNLRIAHALNGETGTALAGASDIERAIIYNTVGVSALSYGRREYARHMFNRALTAHPRFYQRAYENLERTRFMASETEG